MPAAGPPAAPGSSRLVTRETLDPCSPLGSGGGVGPRAPGMQALRRLIEILETVAAAPQPVGAAEVALAMGLPLSTVARLMRQLLDEGLLVRAPDSGRYALGPRLFALTSAGGRGRASLLDVARPALERLRDETGETTSLHVLSGTQRVCVAEAQSHHPVRRVVPVGLAQPLVGTATGEVLLAAATDDARGAALDGLELSAAGRRRIDRRIAAVREDGFAVVDAWVSGLTGISVAIPGAADGAVALSVSGPSERFTARRIGEHRARMRSTVDRVTAQLGASGVG